jgi:acyl-CoA dehydrogenase
MTSEITASDDVTAIINEQADRLFRELISPKLLAASEREHWQGDIWASLEEAGLPLALVPEQSGGIGLSMEATGNLLALAGYHTVPLPIAETIVAQALWAGATGTPLEGPTSLAPTNPTDRVSIETCDGGYRLTGRIRSVPWGSYAKNIVVFAQGQTGDGFLVLLPGFMTWSTISTNLAGEPRADIVVTGIVIPAHLVRPVTPIAADGVFPICALMRAFQMVGAMRRALDLSVQYAGERQQFGRPLGKFQAIQQMLAEAAGHLAASEAGCARGAAEADKPDFPFFAAVAKSRAGEAAGKVAEICHQVHGAMGFTQEHSLHFATRRLWSWRDEFGGEAYWQEIIGRAVCAVGGTALWPRITARSDKPESNEL